MRAIFLPLFCLSLSLFAGDATTQPKKNQIIFPDAGPRIVDGVDFMISADFIFWTAREDGLAFAASGHKNFVNRTPKSGEVYHPNFSFDAGFKVALGYATPHDGWDVWGEYTWLQSHAGRRSVSQNPNKTNLLRLWQPGGQLNPIFTLFEADGKWKIFLNVIDVELGRNFFVSKYLKFRPHFGMKGTWQTQDYVVRYTGQDISGFDRQERIHIQQEYWGFGPRAGFDTAWHFYKKWAIYGDFAISALWGQFGVERTDRFVDNDIPFYMINTENDPHSIKSVMEWELGIRFETWFSFNHYYLSMQVGWEQQIWLDQNQFFHVLEESAHGDLTFQGLTAKIRFEF